MMPEGIVDLNDDIGGGQGGDQLRVIMQRRFDAGDKVAFDPTLLNAGS